MSQFCTEMGDQLIIATTEINIKPVPAYIMFSQTDKREKLSIDDPIQYWDGQLLHKNSYRKQHLTASGWWGSSSGALGRVENSSIAIIPRPTLTRSCSTNYGSIYCSNKSVLRVLVLDRNTWYGIIVCIWKKSFLIKKIISWEYIMVYKISIK